MRQRTYERYESIVRVHIKPAIGRVKLKALTPAHVRALYREKLDSGLSPRSVNYIHVTLHKALSQATSDGLVQRNAAQVKAPRPQKPEIEPLSQDQAHKLMDTAYEIGDRYAALYVVALHTGLREGEMLGLGWDDLDLEATKPTLRVRRTLSETRTGHKFELPKNGKGRRVELTKKAVKALRNHRARHDEEKPRSGPLWQDNGLVFPTTTGTTTSATNLLGRHFKPLLKRAGLPAIRLHDLRYNTPRERQAPQVRAGDVRPHQHLHHAGHLQPRDRGHGRRARGRFGRCALMSIAAALLPPGEMARPGCGEYRIDKLMRP